MYFDIKSKFVGQLQGMALAVLLATGTAVASADTVHVAIDTSGFGVSIGAIDMQFVASGGPLATASITNLVGFNTLPDINWDVEQIVGGYKFRNDTANFLSLGAAFGGSLSFDLSISGGTDAAFVSTFLVSAWDGSAYVGNTNSFGALATFDWVPSSTGVGGDVLLNISDTRVTAAQVPEPSGLALSAIGAAAMLLALFRRRKARVPAARPDLRAAAALRNPARRWRADMKMPFPA